MTVALEMPVSGVTLQQLAQDPYPHYRHMRDLAPVVWVSSATRYFVTRYKDILQVERAPAVFSSEEPDSMMNRAIGATLLRLDGAAHGRIRAALDPHLRQGAIREFWKSAFQEVIGGLFDRLERQGEADLFEDFAAPCAASCLGRMLGLKNADAGDLRRWSQAIIDGCGNYADDPIVWKRCHEATREIELAIADMVPHLRANPDGSLISALLSSPEHFTPEEIRSNAMVLIGGGLNEPRDAIVVATYALLTNPDQLQAVLADGMRWPQVFEEAVRWVSPVGMYPRRATCRTELLGYPIEEGELLGVIVASGNRDERVFERPDVFDINRPRKPNLAFGGGAHYCMGVWSSRVMVGELALPQLFSRFRDLALTDAAAVRWNGWVFRGPANLPVRWQPS